MEPAPAPGGSGTFEARYLAFIETIGQLRPRLHRYCARMTGSVLDGEDVVQEALVVAYRKLDTFDEARPLAPWLFRIAHNRCIDFLRRRRGPPARGDGAVAARGGGGAARSARGRTSAGPSSTWSRTCPPWNAPACC